MASLPDRLKELRKTKGVTQRNVAEYLGIREQAYQRYELGLREPKIETLNKLAGYFKTSVDYLVGFEPVDYDD